MAFDKVRALGEAEKLVGQGKISQAIKQYLHIIDKDPSDYGLLNTVGDLHARERNISAAIECFRTLADQYIKDRFTLKAIAILRKISKLQPEAAEPLAKLAGLYQVQGLVREAREHYFLLVDLYRKKGQIDAALATLQTVVQLDPDNVAARARVAMFCEQTGRTDDAVQAYLEATTIALKRNDLDTAQSVLTKATALEADSPRVRLLQARVAFARQEPAEVEAILTAEPPLTDDPAAQQLLFESYVAGGNLEAAERLALLLYRGNPADFRPILSYLDLCLEKSAADAALRPLAEIAVPLKEIKEATPVMEALRRIWAAFPRHLPTLELIHDICERTADEFALPEILGALGQVYDQAGDIEKAEAVYRKLLHREPQNLSYWTLLAKLLEKQGKEIDLPAPLTAPAPTEVGLAEEAEAPLPEAAGSLPPSPEELARQTMVAEAIENSDLFCRYGLVDKAVAELEKVLAIYPDAAEIHRRVLEVCHRTRPERAAQAHAALVRLAAEKSEVVSEASSDMAAAFEASSEEGVAPFGGAEPAAAPAVPSETMAPPSPIVPETPVAEPSAEVAPLPSEMPLEAAAPEVAAEPSVPDSASSAAEEFDLLSDLEALIPPAAAPAMPPVNPDEVRQEVEFYLSSGFVDEAGRVLAEAESALPGDPQLVALRVRVDEALAHPALPPGEPEPTILPEPVSSPAPALIPEVAPAALPEDLSAAAEQPASPGEDWELPTSFGEAPAEESPTAAPSAGSPASQPAVAANDLWASLADNFASSLDALVAAAPPPGSGASPVSAADMDTASLLSELLGDMGEIPGEEDPETHYNLGVAFREMDLLDEAIGEFQKVVRPAQQDNIPPNFLQSCSLLATCFLEKKMPSIAAKWYERALATPGLDEETTLALHYELGLAQEQAGEFARALDNFTEVYSQNIDYRDVAEKIQALRQNIS